MALRKNPILSSASGQVNGTRAYTPRLMKPAVVHTGALVAMLGALAAQVVDHERMVRTFRINPFWDPELVYLMNSLLVFQGRSYTFIDHPGTPLEMIGSALLALTWPFVGGGNESFAARHVRDPALALTLAHVLLAASCMAVMVLLARRAVSIERWDDVIPSLAVAAAYFAFHPHAITSLAFWSHNSFSFPAGTLLTLLLLLKLDRDQPPGWRWTAGMGLATGALAAVQLYFAAWIGGAGLAVALAHLFHGRGWGAAVRAACLLGAGALAGFVAATLPILPRYRQFVFFVGRLLSRQGVYGSGEAGFTSPGVFWQHLSGLLQVTPGLFITLAAGALFIAAAAVAQRRRLRARAGLWAVALAVFAQAIVLTIAIAKHPALLYTLSLAALLPIVLAMAFTVARSWGRPGRLACVSAGLALLYFATGNYQESRLLHRIMFQRMHVALRQMDALLERGGHADGRPPALWTWGTEGRCVALWISNHYADEAFTNEVSRACPRDGALWGGMVKWPVAAPASRWIGAEGTLVTTERTLRTDPSVETWGTPRPTGIQSPFLGEYLVISFPLNRLRGVMPRREFKAAPPSQ
jgi:hypothetical protein